MIRNRIPRTRDGARDWHRLDRNERRVLAAVYRRPMQTVTGLSLLSGLSECQVAAALAHLTDSTRGHALGCRGAVLAGLDGADGTRYRITPEWEATGRAPSGNRPPPTLQPRTHA